MDNWIEEKIRVAQEGEQVRAKAREWLMYSEQIFQKKMPLLWKALFSRIKQLVETWNVTHPRNNPLWIEFQAVVPDGLLARRVQFPTMVLRAWLDKDDHSVRFSLAIKVDRETAPIESEGRLRIVLMEQGDGELHFFNGGELTEDEVAAQLIIDSLLK